MANKIISNLNLIWDSLGTFWGNFPDKAIITKFWEIYLEVVQEMFRRKTKVHLTRLLENLDAILTYTDKSYLPIFSGDNKNTVIMSGLHTIETNPYTFSIPTLSGIETGQVLTEGTEYQIKEKKYIQFLSVPTYDSANTAIDNRVTLYSNNEYRHNPALWSVLASGIGLPLSSLENEDYLPYNTIAASGIQRTTDIANHYKYLVWSLREMKQRAPTIKNLKTAFGISRGLPFTSRAGEATSYTGDTLTITVSGLTGVTDTYDLPTGHSVTFNVGDNLPQFQVLISGVNFYDHVNNYAYIIGLPNVNDFNYTSEVVFTYGSSLDSLNYSQTFHNTYVTSLMPAGVNYQSLVE